MARRPNYPQVGKTLSLTPGERFALLQALGSRRSFLENGSMLTASGQEQLGHVKELISRVGYVEDELEAQLQLSLDLVEEGERQYGR